MVNYMLGASLMKFQGKMVLFILLFGLIAGIAAVAADDSEVCVACHIISSPALVMQWQESLHADQDVGCLSCHETDTGDIDAWDHFGYFVSPLVTPKDCAACHEREYEEFRQSHHAKAGEIIASLDNVLAEKAAGLPGNIADAVNGCWQCHGSIIKYERDARGEIVLVGPYKRYGGMHLTPVHATSGVLGLVHAHA